LGIKEVSVKLHGDFVQRLTFLMESSLFLIRLLYFIMNAEALERFCKDASQTFFNEFGLISHQINSFNQFIWLFKCVVIESSFDQSNRRRETCHHYIWKS